MLADVRGENWREILIGLGVANLALVLKDVTLGLIYWLMRFLFIVLVANEY
jgi:hypothetical protein